MEQYQQVASLYQKYEKTQWRGLFFCILMLIVASSWVAFNLIKIQPLLVYAIFLGISLLYVRFSRVESVYYQDLKAFLRIEQSDWLKNKKLLFFIDYQLANEYPGVAQELAFFMKTPAKKREQGTYEGIEEVILTIKNRYELFALEELNLSSK